MSATYSISRRNKILELVVDSYVSTAIPVGSFVVSKRLRDTVSPATVRNIMSELEELGYIMHPHTSAGRIPTDKGYRFYIDSIMGRRQLTSDDRDLVELMLDWELDGLEDMLKRTARLISELTGQASMVSFPQAKKRTFRRMELIPVSSKKIYTLLFTAQGVVRHSVFELQDQIDETELSRLSRFLNDELSGLQLSEITDHLLRKVLGDSDPFHYLFKEAIEVFNLSRVLDDKNERVFLDGAYQIADQPEFRESGKMSSLLKVLEEEEEILRIMEEGLSEDGVKIHIGSENTLDDIKGCSIVISNYKAGDQNIGSVGVIGPTRMDYSKTIPVVEYVSEIFSRLLAKFSE
ncbi:MAG: heat-inducible transcriptional repressor HrcA [Candidatus Omnitrophota bacterium]